MATTGIGAGIVGEGLIVLTALLERCTKRMIIHVCAKMIASGSILCAAFEVLMGAILYKYNYQRQQRPDLNNALKLPFDKHVLKAGFYLECAAGGLFILTLLLSFLDIMYYDRRDASSVSPSESEKNPKINENVKKTIESKKDNEKLVIEDLTEKKAEKKK
ncbi:uncharacterized protein LOC111135766 [Crassostrea virginica]